MGGGFESSSKPKRWGRWPSWATDLALCDSLHRDALRRQNSRCGGSIAVKCGAQPHWAWCL